MYMNTGYLSHSHMDFKSGDIDFPGRACRFTYWEYLRRTCIGYRSGIPACNGCHCGICIYQLWNERE